METTTTKKLTYTSRVLPGCLCRGRYKYNVFESNLRYAVLSATPEPGYEEICKGRYLVSLSEQKPENKSLRTWIVDLEDGCSPEEFMGIVNSRMAFGKFSSGEFY